MTKEEDVSEYEILLDPVTEDMQLIRKDGCTLPITNTDEINEILQRVVSDHIDRQQYEDAMRLGLALLKRVGELHRQRGTHLDVFVLFDLFRTIGMLLERSFPPRASAECTVKSYTRDYDLLMCCSSSPPPQDNDYHRQWMFERFLGTAGKDVFKQLRRTEFHSDYLFCKIWLDATIGMLEIYLRQNMVAKGIQVGEECLLRTQECIDTHIFGEQRSVFQKQLVYVAVKVLQFRMRAAKLVQHYFLHGWGVSSLQLCSEDLESAEKCVALSARVLGEYDPMTCRTRSGLAALYLFHFKFEKAIEVGKSCLQQQLCVLGLRHTDTLLSYLTLAETLRIGVDYKYRGTKMGRVWLARACLLVTKVSSVLANAPETILTDIQSNSIDTPEARSVDTLRGLFEKVFAGLQYTMNRRQTDTYFFDTIAAKGKFLFCFSIFNKLHFFTFFRALFDPRRRRKQTNVYGRGFSKRRRRTRGNPRKSRRRDTQNCGDTNRARKDGNVRIAGGDA